MVALNLQTFLLALPYIYELMYLHQGHKCYNCICDKRGDNDTKDCDRACFSSGGKDKVDTFKLGADADKALPGKDCLGKELKGPTCICSADLCTCQRPSDVAVQISEILPKEEAKKCICREDMNPILKFLLSCDVRFYMKRKFRKSNTLKYVPNWFRRMSKYIPPFHFDLE